MTAKNLRIIQPFS